MSNYKDIDFSELDLDVIVEYISKKCDAEVKMLLLFTEENFNKLADSNNQEREFYILYQKFQQFKEIVEYQIRKEELILFPFLKELIQNKLQSKENSNLFKKLDSPIDIISRDHQKILSHLSILEKYYIHFLDVDNELLKLCINGLIDLDKSIKENFEFHKSILFPKILAMQTSNQNVIN